MKRVFRALVMFVSILMSSTGCRFNPALTAEAQITCQSPSECPIGFRCSLLLQRCVSQASSDTNAPQLSAVWSEKIVRPGTAVSFTVRTNEPAAKIRLRASPEVQGRLEPAEFSTVEENVNAVLQVAPVAEDGVIALRGTVVDAAGNENVDVDLGALEVDGTRPVIRAVNLSRTLVRPDQDVLIQVAFSEPVQAGVNVLASNDAGTTLMTVHSAETSAVMTANLRVPPGALDGPLVLRLQGVHDRAGNPIDTGADNLGTLNIDGTAPMVLTSPLLRNRFSRNAGFDTVTIPVLVDDPESTVVVCLFNDCRAARHAQTVEFAIDATMPEGSTSVSLFATDAAGNSSRQVNLPITIDYTPPQLVPSSINLSLTPPPGCPLARVNALTAGARLTLQLGLSEPVAPGTEPQVSMMGASSGALTLLSGLNATYFYEMVVPSTSTANGTLRFTLHAQDDVGNQSTIALPGVSTELDTQPPAVPPVATPNQVTYLRAPWGTSTGGPAFSVQARPGSIEADTIWRVLPAPTPNAGELARLAPLDGGSGFVDLPELDRAAIYLSAVDSACNATAPVDVKEVKWVVTSGGKIAGSSVPNPHGFIVARSVTSAPIDTGATAKNIALRDGLVTTVMTTHEWVQRLTAPAPRTGAAMVWDSWRRRVVLFGGKLDGGSATYFDDLWEFDGRQWFNRTPTSGPLPGARAEHGMAFDSTRNRVVVFGGTNSAGALADTWEWDGASWFNRSGNGGPNARNLHAMAYDPTRQRTVMFGGLGSNAFSDTWEWDGSRWVGLSPASKPSQRFRHSLVFDSARNAVVLFGGGQSGTFFNELWQWDGSNWAMIAPIAGGQPSGRQSSAVIHDSDRQKLVVFGGITDGGLSGETWEFGNNRWAQVATGGPLPRSQAAAAFDPVRHHMVLATGAENANHFNDVWLWAGSAWVNQTPSTAPVPSARSQHASVFDSARSKTLVFGGATTSSGSVVNSDLWQWDGETWSNATPQVGVTPGARRLHSMAFDSDRNAAIIFGGFNNGALNDLWEWTGSQFVPQPPTSGAPAARLASTLAYDATHLKLTMFSGLATQNANSTLNDLWEWSGGIWQQQTSTGVTPAARGYAASIFEPMAGGLLMFGGSRGNELFDDLWLLANGSWSRVNVNNARPSARTQHAMAYDSGRGRTVLFGGSSSSNLPETWEWDRQAWEDVSNTGQRRPTGRRSHSLSYDSRRQVSVLFGGLSNGNSTLLDDTWEWGTAAASRPGFNSVIIFGSAGADVAWVNQISIEALAGATGWANAVATPGVALALWENDSFISRSTSTAPANAPASISWSTVDKLQIGRLFTKSIPQLSVALMPLAPADGALVVQPAELAIDSFEVTVQYRRP